MVGRKKALIAANVTFLVFSLGCGLSQKMYQLIIFRSLQGVGGAGIYALVSLCTYEISTKPNIPIYGAMAAATVALASLTGPLIGGTLAESQAWKWVFLVNLPPGAIGACLLVVVMPAKFGKAPPKPLSCLRPSLSLFKNLDAMGIFLGLAASLLLVAVLNETNVEFPWSSRTTICLLTLSGCFWAAFFAWEWYMPPRWSGLEPIFPRDLFCNKAFIGILTTNFLCGCPWNVVIVYLAQRFQLLNQLSPLEAGIRIIPYTAVATVMTIITCLMSRKARIPVIYFALSGSILHTVGNLLLSSQVQQASSFFTAGYGYQAMAGAGVGISLGILTLATPYVVETKDLATATGALTQARFLGGAVGLAIASNILYGRLKTQLSEILSPQQLSDLLASVDTI
ncbi:unnamed protein product [Penicillium salamii]|uniref:Major facilitator superfamily (MFS) profile domain-containing protein n=1 Tax=Penicillium salamii TaxID=1612424 RepID=A0A9W4N4P3_9EURO|nr:unnamed protein product [Penicillium salamii]